MTDRLVINNKQFYFCLVLILLLGGAIRLPGVQSALDLLSPDDGYSLHTDEDTFISDAMRFHKHPHRGYVRGFAGHIYVVKVLAEKIFATTPDLALVSRLISLIYGILTLGLVALIVKIMTSSSVLSLLTTGFLSVAPLHIINSHFGTPDSAAIFYFYLAAFLAWYHVKYRSEPAFVLFAASVGIAMAIKLVISLLIPLALIVLFYQNKIQKVLLACLIIPGSFSLASLFNYTPWDFVAFLNYLQNDTIDIANGNSRLQNILIYSHGAFSSLGLGTALFMLIGLVHIGIKTPTFLNSWLRGSSVSQLIMRIIKHPITVFFSPFAIYLYLVTGIGYNAIRYLLPFIPLLCVAAAIGFRSMILNKRLSRTAIIASFVLVSTYQVYNAIATEMMFTNDIRYDAAKWLEENVSPQETVTAFMNSSRVGKKVAFIRTYLRPKDHKPSDYIVTNHLEYARYFRSDDASKVHHAYGGQERLDLFRRLFFGQANYAIIKDFRTKQYSLELYLIDKDILRSLELFIPYRYVIFKKLESGNVR